MIEQKPTPCQNCGHPKGVHLGGYGSCNYPICSCRGYSAPSKESGFVGSPQIFPSKESEQDIYPDIKPPRLAKESGEDILAVKHTINGKPAHAVPHPFGVRLVLDSDSEGVSLASEGLKEIIELLPKLVKGRELTLNHDKTNHMWYVGHPTIDGDFSVGLYGWDRDIEGAALSLLSQLDKEAKDGESA